jgi:DNA-binding protein YbaB
MQKVINGIALLSGLVSLSVLGGGAYLYLNADSLLDQGKEQLTKLVAGAATDAVSGALPGMLDSSMPALPKTTGPAVPVGVPAGGMALPKGLGF